MCVQGQPHDVLCIVCEWQRHCLCTGVIVVSSIVAT